MEDELRDPRNFAEYLLPRPLRLAFFGGSAASCLIASVLTAVRLLQSPAVELADGSAPRDLIVNLIGLVTFAALFTYDQQQAGVRVEQRRVIRAAQIRAGDREVFVNEAGERMSRLKDVDDEWVLRRLERWGRREAMPFVGPEKAALLRGLVAERAPRLAVEVGTMAGYSAIAMAQALPPGARLLTFERDLTWWLVAQRFMWQASQGQANVERGQRLGDRVRVVWGDARDALPRALRAAAPASPSPSPAGAGADGAPLIDFLFLDGVPKESLDCLRAAEPWLAPGAVVVADNAGVFAKGGMAPYLEYVRGDPRYTSRLLPCKLEWREDVEDGMEVSTWLGGAAAGAAGPSS